MFEYNAVVVKVVDGDTVDVDIDLGFSVWLKKQRVRLYGLDTPESRTRDKEEKKYGLLAKAKVLEHCPIGSKIKVKTQKGKSKGKYGRILGELISDKSVNVNKFLIDNNYGVDYHGFSKEELKKEHLKNRKIIQKRGEI